jgi:hypothetical protein
MLDGHMTMGIRAATQTWSMKELGNGGDSATPLKSVTARMSTLAFA